MLITQLLSKLNPIVISKENAYGKETIASAALVARIIEQTNQPK